jgi:hypothetical protein
MFCASLLSACGQEEKPVQYDSLAELSGAVGFDVINPEGMPDGYVLAGYYAVGDKLAQIVYVYGDAGLIFAMTPLKKVECSFDDFDETKTVNIDGIVYDYSLSGGSVRLAVARAGDYTYAIYAKDGLTEEEMRSAVIGLKLK